MAGAVFRIRVLVPPSIAWCCFGIDTGQSRQRDRRNIGLRTLWLGGFFRGLAWLLRVLLVMVSSSYFVSRLPKLLCPKF